MGIIIELLARRSDFVQRHKSWIETISTFIWMGIICYLIVIAGTAIRAECRSLNEQMICFYKNRTSLDDLNISGLTDWNNT